MKVDGGHLEIRKKKKSLPLIKHLLCVEPEHSIELFSLTVPQYCE